MLFCQILPSTGMYLMVQSPQQFNLKHLEEALKKM